MSDFNFKRKSEDPVFVSANVIENGLRADGVTGNSQKLIDLINSIGSDPVELNFPSGTYNIDANVTIPANVILDIANGAVFSVASTKTLTINGEIRAGLYQIFDGLGTVVLNSVKDFETWRTYLGLKLYADNGSHPITSDEITEVCGRVGISNVQTFRFDFANSFEQNEIVLPFVTRNGVALTKSDLKVGFDNSRDNYLETGTSQATGDTGDHTKIKLSSTSSAVDDYYNSFPIEIIDGETRLLRTVADYDGTTKIVTLTTATTFDNNSKTYTFKVNNGCTSIGDTTGTISGCSESLYSLAVESDYSVLSIVNNDKLPFQHGAVDVTGDIFNVGDEWDYVTIQAFILAHNKLMENTYFSQTTGEFNLDKVVQKKMLDIKSGIYMINKTLMFGIYHPLGYDRLKFTPWNIKGAGFHATTFKGTSKNRIMYMYKIRGSEIGGFALVGKQNPAGAIAKKTDCYAGLELVQCAENTFANIAIEDCYYGANLLHLNIFNVYQNLQIRYCEYGWSMQRFTCQSTWIGGQVNDCYTSGIYLNGCGGWDNYSLKFISTGFHFNAGISGNTDNRDRLTNDMTVPGYAIKMINNSYIFFDNCYFEGNGTAGNNDVYSSDTPCSTIGMFNTNPIGDKLAYNRQVSFDNTYVTSFQSVVLLKGSGAPGIKFDNSTFNFLSTTYCTDIGVPETVAAVNPKSTNQDAALFNRTRIKGTPPSNWGVMPLTGLSGAELSMQCLNTTPYTYSFVNSRISGSDLIVTLTETADIQKIEKIIPRIGEMQQRYNIILELNPSGAVAAAGSVLLRNVNDRTITIKNISDYDITFSTFTFTNTAEVNIVTTGAGRILSSGVTGSYMEKLSITSESTGVPYHIALNLNHIKNVVLSGTNGSNRFSIFGLVAENCDSITGIYTFLRSNNVQDRVVADFRNCKNVDFTDTTMTNTGDRTGVTLFKFNKCGFSTVNGLLTNDVIALLFDVIGGFLVVQNLTQATTVAGKNFNATYGAVISAVAPIAAATNADTVAYGASIATS